MPNKLTINHIMNMIQAHNELCAYAPQAHRLGAWIDIDTGDGYTIQMFSESYIYTSKQLWDLLREDYEEDFIEKFVNAEFKTNPLTNYIEAEFDIRHSNKWTQHYRVIVSIWER